METHTYNSPELLATISAQGSNHNPELLQNSRISGRTKSVIKAHYV